jgi:uncharacterized delta-60 repeat protein
MTSPQQNHPIARTGLALTSGVLLALASLGACNSNPASAVDAAAVPVDGGADGGPASAKTFVVPLSATGPDRFYGVAYDAQGNFYATGQVADSTDASADYATVVAKFKPTGELDPSFGSGGWVRRNVAVGTTGELFRGIVVQSTGKIVVSGTVEHAGATDARDRDIALLRFNPDGTKDPTFGTDGVVILDLSAGVVNGSGFAADSAWGLERYPDDRLVVSGGQVRAGGTDTDFVLVRLTANGARDATFATSGVFTLDIQQNGASSNASPRSATILPGTDGIVGAGYQPLPGADTAPVVYKVTDSGQLDPSFGVGGIFSQALLAEQTECYAAVVQPAEQGGYKLVTTGYGRALPTETTDLVSLRLNANGTLDRTYGNSGLLRIDIGGFGDNSRRLAVLPDRRILLAGGGRRSAANVDGLVALLTPDGQPDSRFAAGGWQAFELGGPADFLWGVAVSPDQQTAAFVGLKGAGANPMPATANDDAALVLLPLGS